MEKLKKIYEEINTISPIRFAVRLEWNRPIIIEDLEKNIDRFRSIYAYTNNEVTISYAENLETSILENIEKSKEKVSLFFTDTKMGVVFDHSVADAKTAITFCVNILKSSYLFDNECDIGGLLNVFPSKHRGLGGRGRTLKAAILQVFTSLIQGKTTYSKHHVIDGSFESLNVISKKLTKAETAALIQGANASSSSISALLLSAQIKAAKNMLFEDKDVAIGVTVAVDLRQRCMEKPRYDFLSLCVSFLTVVVQVKKNESFMKVLAKVKNKLHYKIKTGAHFTLYKMLPPKYLISQSVVRFFLNLNEKSSLQTNVGRIEDFYTSPINLKSIDFFVPPGENQPFSLSVSTFKGELSISIVSFENRLSAKLANRILADIIASITNKSFE